MPYNRLFRLQQCAVHLAYILFLLLLRSLQTRDMSLEKRAICELKSKYSSQYGNRIGNLTVLVQNGHWSDWVKAGKCSKSCGGGKQTQRRTCTSPAPRNGGRDCSGDSSRSIDCNLQPCPVDGQWSAWVNRGNCTEPCGGGKQQQKRFCNNPAPQTGGRDCEGEHIRLIYCNQQACKSNL